MPPGRHGTFPPKRMDAPAKAITALLLENWPNTYCYPCLAGKLKLVEKEIRDGAQALALLPEFRILRLRCAECGRQGEVLQMRIGDQTREPSTPKPPSQR